MLSRPELKVERVSYEVLTPSAARGIVEAIYYHPGLRWKIRKIFPGMELCSMLLLLLLMAHPWQQREKITFLDVGQGDASLLQSGGQTLLLDGGSTSQKNVGTYVILPYIKQQGISCLEAVVLTHTDQDHINGVTEVLEEGKKRLADSKKSYVSILDGRDGTGKTTEKAGRRSGSRL